MRQDLKTSFVNQAMLHQFSDQPGDGGPVQPSDLRQGSARDRCIPLQMCQYRRKILLTQRSLVTSVDIIEI